MVNLPDLSVVAFRSNWLTGLWISTVALGTTAPDGSATVPVTEVELPPDCATAFSPNAKKNSTQKAA